MAKLPTRSPRSWYYEDPDLIDAFVTRVVPLADQLSLYSHPVYFREYGRPLDRWYLPNFASHTCDDVGGCLRP
jgi:hypothetical protein